MIERNSEVMSLYSARVKGEGIMAQGPHFLKC